MAKVALKQPIVDEVSSQVKDASAVILVQYLGITVEQDTKLRKELREAGVKYKVFKNTMMHRAFEGTELDELTKDLKGPNALAIAVDDPSAPARIISKYAKTVKCLSLIGGIVEGRYMDQAALSELASIPTREVLLGRLLGSMQGTISGFARVLKQIADKGRESSEAPAEEAAPAAEAEAPAAEASAAETTPEA